MWNVFASNKGSYKFATFIFILIVLFGTIFTLNKNPIIFQTNSSISVAHAESTDEKQSKKENEVEGELSDNIDKVLGEIDSTELDEFIVNDFEIDFVSDGSFISMVKGILNNNYFSDYKSLFSIVISFVFKNIKQVILFFLSLFGIVFINQIFDSFCENKYKDLKVIIKIIFSLVIATQIIVLLKEISNEIDSTILKSFNFSEKLFPILLGLILASGSSGTFSIYSTLSAYLIETGLYLFKFVLLPIVFSMMLLSIMSIAFEKNNFSKLISLLKCIFKYIILVFFTIFGLFSTINLFSSATADGINYKVTKFAIKYYIPVLGGYLSDGFDFVRTCSLLVKNSFGICGIITLFFIILKPVIVCITYILLFKIVSVLVALIGQEKYANYFEEISSTFSYYISILVGVFLCFFVFIFLLIISVSTIWLY